MTHIFFLLASLLALACAHRGPPTLELSAASDPEERRLREGCNADFWRDCQTLGLGLVRGAWGEGREAEGFAVLDAICLAETDPGRGDQLCPDDGISACLAAHLTLLAHPGLGTPDQLDRAELGACADGYPVSCRQRAERLAETDPAEAQKAWREACRQLDPAACARVTGASPAGPTAPLDLPDALRERLAQAHLSLQPPPGFRVTPVHENPDFPYHLGLRSEDGTLELRVRADPASAGTASLAELARQHVQQVQASEPTASAPMDELTASSFFNADAAEVIWVTPREGFAPGWTHAAVLTMRREGLGLGTVVILHRDSAPPSDKSLYAANYALRFTDPRGP